jgi:hypothetical protein
MMHLACNSVAAIGIASLLVWPTALAHAGRSSLRDSADGASCRVLLDPPAEEPAPGPAQSQDGAVPSYDADCLKKAIENVKRRAEAEAKKFTDQNRDAAQREYDAAKASWDAERKRRNSTRQDDDRGRANNGVNNRDDNFGKRSSGNKAPPAPKMRDFQSWADLMKSEVAAERKADPASGKRGGKPLMPKDDPLAGKEMADLVKSLRDSITDARLASMIKDVRSEYRKLLEARKQEPATGTQEPDAKP